MACALFAFKGIPCPLPLLKRLYYRQGALPLEVSEWQGSSISHYLHSRWREVFALARERLRRDMYCLQVSDLRITEQKKSQVRDLKTARVALKMLASTGSLWIRIPGVTK